MVLPPRELLIRLLFWGAVLAWAVWKIRDLSTGTFAVPELLAPPPAVPAGPVPILPPTPPTTPEGAAPVGSAPDLVDPEAAVAAMDAAMRAASGCGVHGTIGVRLGEGGLAEAWIEPAGSPPDAAAAGCLAAALWTPTWPRTTLGFEMERAIGGP